jgi:hypothetical protein
MCFVPVNGAIRMMFGLEDPFATNQVDMTRPWHQSPGAGLTKSGELSRHGITPRWFSESLSMRKRSGKESTTM